MPSGVAHGDGVYHHEAVIHVSESLLGPEVCAPDLGAYQFKRREYTMKYMVTNALRVEWC